MNTAEIAGALRDTLTVIVKLAAPPLLTALFVGLVVSLIQTITSINEATLTFVPKAVAIGAVLLFMGSFMLLTLTDYTNRIFADLVTVGGS